MFRWKSECVGEPPRMVCPKRRASSAHRWTWALTSAGTTPLPGSACKVHLTETCEDDAEPLPGGG
jgi:hypothetical protein